MGGGGVQTPPVAGASAAPLIPGWLSRHMKEINKIVLAEVQKGADPLEVLGQELGVSGLTQLSKIADEGFQASPQDLELINTAYSNARARVGQDLDFEFSRGIDIVRNQVAGRGVAESSIMSDAIARSLTDKVRAGESAYTSLAGQQAESELQAGRDRANFLMQYTGQTVGTSQSSKAQRYNLMTGSAANATNLAGNFMSAGASIYGSQMQGQIASAQIAQQRQQALFEMIATGVGTAVGVAGGMAARCSKKFKDDKGPAPSLLPKIKALPIRMWNYKGEDTAHIGPYAEDMQSLFHVGDGVYIQFIDALGILFKAFQELLGKVETLEVSHGNR